MNIELYNNLKLFCFVLMCPFLLVLLKCFLAWLFKSLGYIAYDKTDHFIDKCAYKYKVDYISKFNYECEIEKLVQEGKVSAAESAKDINKIKRLEKCKNIFHAISDALECEVLCFGNNWVYSYFCFVAGIALVVGLAFRGSFFFDYHEQKKFLESNFEEIRRYENYKSDMWWDIDAREVCIMAEQVNKDYFNRDSSKRFVKFYLIKDEYTEDLKPINTNEMWQDFLIKIDSRTIDVVR